MRRQIGASLRRHARVPGVVAAAAAFDPVTSDATLIDILDARTLSATPVSSWAGRKGVITVTQATGTAQPAWSSSNADWGGVAAVSFDGGDHLRNASISAITAPFTVYAVARVTVNATNKWIVDFATRGSIYAATSWRSDLPMAGITLTGESAADDIGIRKIHCLHVAENGGTHRIFTDAITGGSLGTQDAQSTSTGTHSATRITVGAYDDTTLRWTGEIAAIAVASGLHDATTRQQYYDYFSGIWGL